MLNNILNQVNCNIYKIILRIFHIYKEDISYQIQQLIATYLPKILTLILF